MPQPLITKIFAPSENFFRLIEEYEGYEPVAKHQAGDADDVFTGGFGSVYNIDGSRMKNGTVHTREEWKQIMMWEAQNKTTSLNNLLKNLPVTQNMFDTCLSFCYEEGIGTFENSSIYRAMKINPLDKRIYDYDLDDKTGYGVPLSCYFLSFTKANGVRLPGIVRRRTSEAHLYITGELKFFE